MFGRLKDMGQYQRVTRSFSASGCPATVGLISANVATFFLSAIFPGLTIWKWLYFSPISFFQTPWTLITWPLILIGSPITLLFAGIWAFWSCGSVERAWGTRTFLLFFFVTNAIMALGLWLGIEVLSHGGLQTDGIPLLWGLAFGVAPPTIAFCTINKREAISLYALFPIPAWALALFTLVLVWYDVGPPLLGLFPLLGCAAAWWYADRGRMMYRGYATLKRRSHLKMQNFDQESTAQNLSLMKKYKAWQERKKLEALWKRSSDSDPEEKNKR